MVALLDRGIQFEQVTFGYGRQGEPIIRQVDWEISEGSFVVVAGESGSGKSTLLRCLNGLVPHFSGGRFGGQVTVRGIDTRRSGPRELSASVGFVFQDPDAQRVAAVVEDELAFGMEQRGTSPMQMRKRIEEVLDLLGIADLRDREMDTLSGGERQRVAVAAALTQFPAVLALDEPTSQLDPWGAEDVIRALERLNHDLGLTIVMSEHRLERVLGTADRLRFLGTDGILDGPPQSVLSSLPLQMRPPIAQLAGDLGWDPIPLTIKEARSSARGLRHLGEPRLQGLVGSPTGLPLLSMEGVTLGYGDRSVLRKIDLTLRPGEIVALMGRNGSGKTTLLRSAMGFHRIARGRISVAGQNVTGADPAVIGKSIGYLPQRPGQMLFCDTVEAELRFTAKHHPGSHRDLDETLRALDLDSLRLRHPRDLSSGEQERTALAAMLMAGAPVLLLDEPTRGMDYQRKLALADFLAARSREGVAILLATHDVELVAAVASRVVILGNGEVVADGTPRDVLSGSLSYTTQINKLFSGNLLTVADVSDWLAIARH